MPGADVSFFKLIQQAENINRDIKQAVDSVTHEIFMVSTENYCPVDTGNLKGSAKDETRESSTEYFHEISYSAPHAWWVHELPRRHLNPPSAQRKFLETPVMMYRKKLIDEIKLAYRGAL